MTSDSVVTTTVPYQLARLGVVMRPEPGNQLEAEGVLNPATGRDQSGRLWLLPRLVAAGNASRVGLAEIMVEAGVPVAVRREGIALGPDRAWERGTHHGGIEDPRVTWMSDLGVHLMTYVAYGPLGPRPALAISENLRTWKRLGPLNFRYQDDLDTDLNLYPNKDVVIFPELVPGPDGRPSYAVLHRPMWDMEWIAPDAGAPRPAGLADDRPGIWISYASATDVAADIANLVNLSGHRLVALPEFPFEVLKIGAGPPPIRIPEGWLLIHHGVSGELVAGIDQQQNARYCAGAMILSADDPAIVVARTATPLLAPDTVTERIGIVPNVVFPTATETIGKRTFVFYGMADSMIGVAELIRNQG